MTDIVSFDTETELIAANCKAPRMVCSSFAWFEPRGPVLYHQADPFLFSMYQVWLTNGHMVGHNVAYDLGVVAAKWPELVPLIFQAYEDRRIHCTMVRERVLNIAEGQLRWTRPPAVVEEEEDDDDDDDDDNAEKVDDTGVKLVRSGYSLDKLGIKYLNEYKHFGGATWRLRYGELMGVPIAQWPYEAREYALRDAVLTLKVFRAQEQRRDLLVSHFRCDVLEDASRQASYSWWLDLVTAWGIRTDLGRVQRLREKLEVQRDHALRRLLAEGLVRVQGGKKDPSKAKFVKNTKLVKERLVRVLLQREAAGLPIEVHLTPKAKLRYADDESVPRLTSAILSGGGGPLTLDDIAIHKDACKDSGDETLVLYKEYSHIGKVLSSDIPAMETGEIHARFINPMETGRTSCQGEKKSKAREHKNALNLQNRPVDGGVRECFIPRPGYVFVDCDYDGLELRTWAQCCITLVKKSQLADALNGGLDPHTKFAAVLLKTEYDVAVKRMKDKADKDAYLARQSGKIANFGFPGGCAPKTLTKQAKQKYNVIMDLETAKKLKETWFELWPEAVDYFAHIRDCMITEGNYCVKQLFSNRIRGCCSYTEACNSFFQGLGADATKAAGFALSRACYDETRKSVLFGSRIVNYIHDQFLVEVPEAVAHECAWEVQRIMVTEANKYLPDVPATCTPALCRRWSKGAATIYGADGRLVAWDDTEVSA